MGANRHILVFGAGAAGMTAAITAALAGARVTLAEKTGIPGRKLSMTGNGRCNMTNLEISGADYNRAAEDRMDRWLSVCGSETVIRWFSDRGLFARAEGSGVYPASGQAASVVCALTDAVRRSGVELLTDAQLKEITPSENGFLCRIADRKEALAADAVILATGGLSGPRTCQSTGDAYYICRKLGLGLRECVPALVPLVTNDPTLPEKTGVRAIAGMTLYADGKPAAAEWGEIQFTSHALSGIPVLQASGIAAAALAAGQQVRAEIDFFPEACGDQRTIWNIWTENFTKCRAGDTLENALAGMGNAEINRCIMRRLSLNPAMDPIELTEEQKAALWRQYRAFPVEITGVGDYRHAQATAGGVALEELSDDCEAVRVPGLYIAGELADVDGRCGGYNLQWAFMSGMIAGMHAATGRSCMEENPWKCGERNAV